MYIKINTKGKTMTLCKLIFSNSNKNMLDFNWIYNRTNGFSYRLCECNNIDECKSKIQNKSIDKNQKYNINISKKYKHMLKSLNIN